MQASRPAVDAATVTGGSGGFQVTKVNQQQRPPQVMKWPRPVFFAPGRYLARCRSEASGKISVSSSRT
jgi:hypothetical protein